MDEGHSDEWEEEEQIPQRNNTKTIKKEIAQQREESSLAYSDGGVLRGRDERLTILAEFAMKHGLSVAQKSG